MIFWGNFWNGAKNLDTAYTPKEKRILRDYETEMMEHGDFKRHPTRDFK